MASQTAAMQTAEADRQPRSDYAMPYQEGKKSLGAQLQQADEECQAIPFIKFVPGEGKFELNPEAVEFLVGLGDTKLGIIAVCGKYRTGKSYLMNKLFVETYFQKKRQSDEHTVQSKTLNHQKSGFQVSPTINACTKGLWLWKKVIKAEHPNGGSDISMIVVDTEGLGAYDEDENHDAKIFLLALLLSSLLIYNSVGTIDENALNSLSMVINMSKKIQMKEGQESQEDVDALAKMFPSFLWVLRDFALKLVDLDGNRLTPKQYLESALREQKGCSEAVEQKNRLRRLLTHFFQERDCSTLVRPTEQEKDLQSLLSLKDSQLREEFVEQMGRLKQKVMTKIKVKQINGRSINGSMLVELANSYIKALNDGQIPVIGNAWTNVCHFEQQRSYKDAQTLYQTQIVTRIKLNRDANIDVKSTLNEIRYQALSVLKKDFLGDIKALESYQGKLTSEIKIQSKKVIEDVKNRQDDLMRELITKQIHDELESRVRRNDPSIKDFETLLLEAELLLASIISQNPGNDRVEPVFRKLLQQKLPRFLDSVHSSNCKTPSTQSLLLAERQLKLAQEDVQRVKEERIQMQNDAYEKCALVQRECQELRVREKILEIKLQDQELKFKSQEKVLKAKSALETLDNSCQTERLLSIQDKQVQASTNMIDEKIQTQKERPMLMSVAIQSSETTQNPEEDSQPKKIQGMDRAACPQYMEQNMKLLQEILSTLSKTANLNHTQSSNLEESLNTNKLTEIIQNNQVLSRAIEQAERRCTQLEKKLERKQKYESLIKNCQRLECKECNKLYTPVLFTQHFALCKRQLQAAALRDSHISTSQQESPYYEDKQLEQDDYQSFEGGEAIDVQNQQNNRLSEFVRMQQMMMAQTGEQFLAKVINVTQDNNYRSPYFKEDNQDDKYYTSIQNLPQIELQFCIINQGSVTFVQKTIQQVKTVMDRIKKRVSSPNEQCQVAKWVMEIERNEQDQNFQRIAEIVETFFSLIHRKIIENNLQLNKHVIIEDIDGLQAPQHYYVNEFVEFFEIKDQHSFLVDSQQHVSSQEHLRNLGLQAQPFQTAESQNESDYCAQYQGNRYMQGGDDEVILQTPYDDEDAVVMNRTGGRGSSCVVIQEDGRSSGPIVQMRVNGENTAAMAVLNQHMGTTMNLEEDHSLGMVSFFSGEDDAQIKKDLLNSQSEFDRQSSLSSVELSHHDINEKHPQPFAPIQNTMSYSKPPNSSFLGIHMQASAKPVYNEQAFEVLKKSYQSPLPRGKKSAIEQRRPLIVAAVTQQHNNYFNHGTYQQGYNMKQTASGVRRSRSQFKGANNCLINFYNDL